MTPTMYLMLVQVRRLKQSGGTKVPYRIPSISTATNLRTLLGTSWVVTASLSGQRREQDAPSLCLLRSTPPRLRTPDSERSPRYFVRVREASLANLGPEGFATAALGRAVVPTMFKAPQSPLSRTLHCETVFPSFPSLSFLQSRSRSRHVRPNRQVRCSAR